MYYFNLKFLHGPSLIMNKFGGDPAFRYFSVFVPFSLDTFLCHCGVARLLGLWVDGSAFKHRHCLAVAQRESLLQNITEV
jgi:hypothetical protein